MAFYRGQAFNNGPYRLHPADVLARVLDDVGMTGLNPSQVIFQGGRDEGLININTHVAVLAAGFYAAFGLILDRIGQMRGLPAQAVVVEMDHAAMAMSKMHWVLRNGLTAETAEGPARRGGGFPATGNFLCRDGRWININTAFPGIRNTALRILGCANDREAVVAAVGHWDALALEEAISQQGGAAAMIRTPEEWADHPHGRAMLAQPLVQIEKLGESNPVPFRPWPIAPLLLSGIREIDLTHVLAGPTGTQLSAEAGADVLRIVGHERWVNPIGDLDTGVGKRSAMLSLNDPEHRRTFFDLLEKADAFVQGFNPGSIYGLLGGEEALLAARPGLVLVDESCYGPYGPWADRGGFEQLAQAVSGMMYLQHRFGEASPAKGGEPIMTPVYVNDYLTGLLSAIGKLTAYIRRAEEGGSYRVRAQLARTACFIVEMGVVALEREPHSFTRAEVLLRSQSFQGPLGQSWHLAPVVQLSQTPLRYQRPAPDSAGDSPVWLTDPEVYMNAALMGQGNTYGGGKSWL